MPFRYIETFDTIFEKKVGGEEKSFRTHMCKLGVMVSWCDTSNARATGFAYPTLNYTGTEYDMSFDISIYRSISWCDNLNRACYGVCTFNTNLNQYLVRHIIRYFDISFDIFIRYFDISMYCSIFRYIVRYFDISKKTVRYAYLTLTNISFGMHCTRARLGHASAPVDAGNSPLDAPPAGAEGAQDSVSRWGGHSRRPDDRDSARGAQGFGQGCSRGIIVHLHGCGRGSSSSRRAWNERF